MQKLGRGLDILLNRQNTSNQQIVSDETMVNLPISQLKRGIFQPREEMNLDSLADLVDSIKNQGILQPIIVRKIDDNYEIIAGERRYQAAKLASLTQVPAIVRVLSDKESLAVGLIENIQREALTPLEEAQALLKLAQDFSMTHQEVAAIVSRSRSAVTNLIRLLQLDERVQQLLNSNDIKMGHARALLPLDNEQQLSVANHIIEKRLSVRQTEYYIRKLHQPPASNQAETLDEPVYIKQHIQALQQQYQTDIVLKSNKRNTGGKLVLSYNSLTQLDALLVKMQKTL